MRYLTFFLLLIACAPGFAIQNNQPGALIDVGGYRVHIQCEGYGTPTVVLDVGLGGNALEWRFVVDEVRRFTRVCIYDRPGYGFSEMGRRPRTSSQIANELFLLLDGLDIERPFILVGHSFGGYNMQLFVRRFPYLVAGLVLVDSSHPMQVERFLAPPINLNTAPSSRWGIVKFGNPPAPHKKLPPATRSRLYTAASHWRTRRTLAREFLAFRESARQVQAAPQMGSIPLVVLTRGKRVWPNDKRGNLIEALWVDMQAELAAQSPHSAHIIANSSGHHVHIDQPNLVSYAVALLTDVHRESAGGELGAERQRLENHHTIEFGSATWMRDTLREYAGGTGLSAAQDLHRAWDDD